MKEIIIISLLLLFVGLNGFGQMNDLIIKTNGDSLKCKITLVNNVNIFYKIKKGKNRTENKFISQDLVNFYIRENKKVFADKILSEVEAPEKDSIINPFTTLISDSMGYHTYYAFEIYKNDKLIDYFREGSSIRFTLKRELIDGFWFLKSNPDTILVVRMDGSKDLSIYIHDIKRIAFRVPGDHSKEALALFAVGGVSSISMVRFHPDYKTGFRLTKPYLLSKDHWKPRLRKRKESKIEKEKREKYLKKNE